MRSLVSVFVVALLPLLLTPGPAQAAPGDPVPGFGRAGVVKLPVRDLSPSVTLVAQQPGGRILVAVGLSDEDSWYETSTTIFGLTRRGKLDRRFGRRGRLSSGHPAGLVTMLPNGRLLLAQVRPRSLSRTWLQLTRYTRAGKLDRRFGRRGRLQVPLTQTPAAQIGVALAPDGDLVVVTDASDDQRRSPLMLMRLTGNGTLDPSFGAGGRLELPAYDDLRAAGLAVQRSGRIVVLANVRSQAGLGGQGIALIGLRPDGTLDATFGGYGDGMRALIESSARLAIAHDDEIVLLLTREQRRNRVRQDATVLRLAADAVGPPREVAFPSPTGSQASQLALDERGAAIVSGGERYSTGLFGAVRGFIGRFARDGFDAGFRQDVPARRSLWASDDAGPIAVLSDDTILASANRSAVEGRRGAIMLLRLFGD